MSTYQDFRDVAARCDGYEIHSLTHTRAADNETIRIELTAGPGHPDITLDFSGIHYLQLGYPPGGDADPLTEITTQLLHPSNQPWPDQLNGYDFIRSDQHPPLIWFHAAGPVQLNILATQATATTDRS